MNLRYRPVAACALVGTLALTPATANAQQSAPWTATVTSLEGAIERLSPSGEIALQTALSEGQRLRGPDATQVTLTMHGGGQLQARGALDLTLYQDPSNPTPAGQPPSRESSARRGRFAIEVTGQQSSIALATPACTITVLRGSATLEVTPRHTRLTVLSGRVRVRAMGREVLVREGMGLKVEAGQPAVAHALVAGPVFRGQIPRMFTYGGAVEVPLVWQARGRTPAAQWRVELSREPTFATVLRTVTVPANQTQTTLQGVSAGQFYVRVRGIDADQLEGRWGAPLSFSVQGPHVVPGGAGRLARVEIPEGMLCGLNSSPPAVQLIPMELTPGRNHVLRCQRTPSDPVGELAISADEAGPLSHELRFAGDVSTDLRTLSLRLRDARGSGVAYANVRIEVPAGVRAEPFVEQAQRGVYECSLRWPARVGRGIVRVIVNDAVRLQETLEP